MTDSPIFTKTYDLMVWLLPVLTRFPKEQRFRLAARIETSLFAFHSLILQAARARQRRSLLLEADLELERLRVYLRLAQDVKSLDFKHYAEASRRVVEVGKLLGGWLKTTASPADASAVKRGDGPEAGRVLEQ